MIYTLTAKDYPQLRRFTDVDKLVCPCGCGRFIPKHVSRPENCGGDPLTLFNLFNLFEQDFDDAD